MSLEYARLRHRQNKKARFTAIGFQRHCLRLPDTLNKFMKGETHEQKAID